jgi:hypothetical protein
MPEVRAGILTETTPTVSGLGTSESSALQACFPLDPKFNDLNDAAVQASYQSPRELVDGEVNDGGYMFGSAPVDYRDSPDLRDVVVGGGGLPGSPYGPNVATPREGHDPTTVPAEGVEASEKIRSRSTGYGLGDNTTSPSQTIPGRRLIGQNLPLGNGSGNSFYTRRS